MSRGREVGEYARALLFLAGVLSAGVGGALIGELAGHQTAGAAGAAVTAGFLLRGAFQEVDNGGQ